MNERPILFSGPMVRAILSGQKTQTRRILKAAIPPHWQMFPPSAAVESWSAGFIGPELILPCPYGAPGDRLWVRESMRRIDDGIGYPYPVYSVDGATAWDDGGIPAKWVWRRASLPSIHMPRGLSRIDLEIVGVRVERLRDISERDAQAEGIQRAESSLPDYVWEGAPERRQGPRGGAATYCHRTARDAFATLWNHINGARATWESNPWVWVVGFKRVQS